MLRQLDRPSIPAGSTPFRPPAARLASGTWSREQLTAVEQDTASRADPRDEFPGEEEPRRCPSCRRGALHLTGEVRRPYLPELIAWTYAWKEPYDTS